MTATTATIQVETFLPHLKKLTTGICLARCSSRILLECRRWALVELHLNWFHNNRVTQDGNGFMWEDLPKLWPNLNHLSFDFKSPGPELKKLIQIVPWFESLSRLQLPFAMLKTDKKSAWELTDKLAEEGITLDFNKEHRQSFHERFDGGAFWGVQHHRLQELARAQLEREITAMRHPHRQPASQLARLAVQAAEARRELRQALMERRRTPMM